MYGGAARVDSGGKSHWVVRWDAAAGIIGYRNVRPGMGRIVNLGGEGDGSVLGTDDLLTGECDGQYPFVAAGVRDDEWLIGGGHSSAGRPTQETWRSD